MLSAEGKALYSDLDYKNYKSAYEKYFLNEKIGVLLYDAAPLFDTLLVIGILTLVFKFLHYLSEIIFTSEENLVRRLLSWLRKMFGKKLYIRIFVEIQPILMFHCLT